MAKMPIGDTIKHVMALIPAYPHEVRLSWIRARYKVLDSSFPIFAPLCEYEGKVCYVNEEKKKEFMEELGIKNWKEIEKEAKDEMPKLRKYRAHNN